MDVLDRPYKPKDTEQPENYDDDYDHVDDLLDRGIHRNYGINNP